MIRYDNRYGNEIDVHPKGQWVPYEIANELLQALKGMTSLWATVCNSKGWEPDHVVQFTNARNAILKAEGLDEPRIDAL